MLLTHIQGGSMAHMQNMTVMHYLRGTFVNICEAMPLQ